MPTSIARRFVPVAVLVAVAIAWAAPALADGAHAAIVIKDGKAVLLDAHGRGFVTSKYQKVVTQSKNGNVLFKLRARGVPNATGGAVHWDYNSTGLRCGVYVEGVGLLSTANWRETVSASGNVIFICHL